MFTPELKAVVDSARNRLNATPAIVMDGAQLNLWQGLLKKCQKVRPTADADEKGWMFWVTSQRGGIDAFGEYEDYREEVDSLKEFNTLWLEWYPDETAWHQVNVLYRNTECHLFLEGWFASINFGDGQVATNGLFGISEI